MAQTELSDELIDAEGLLLQNEDEQAYDLLARLAEDAEEYVDRNYQTTDEVQWFSFPTLFDRLAYRRVEKDPRELRDVGEPFERLYADFALSCVRTGRYEEAADALKQAIRWNPMNCAARLDLADLYKVAGDVQQYLALTFSVFERASEVRHLARAFLNFASWFEQTGRTQQAAAALRAARRLDAHDGALDAALSQATGTETDPDTLSDSEADDLLAAEGLPGGANAEIAVCLLMCAQDEAAMGNRNEATQLTIRARDLVGEPAALALLELVRDAALNPETPGVPSAGTSGAEPTPGQEETFEVEPRKEQGDGQA